MHTPLGETSNYLSQIGGIEIIFSSLENTGLHVASMGEGKGGGGLTMYKQKWLIAFLLTLHLSPENVFLKV